MGRAPLTVPHLFLRRYARDENKLSSRVWAVMQDDPAAQMVNQVQKASSLGAQGYAEGVGKVCISPCGL